MNPTQITELMLFVVHENDLNALLDEAGVVLPVLQQPGGRVHGHKSLGMSTFWTCAVWLLRGFLQSRRSRGVGASQ